MTKASWAAIGGAVLIVAVLAAIVIVLMRGPQVPTEALSAPAFVDDTATSGIDHAYDGDWTFFVGGGVAAFDCNDDQKPDLVLAGGENAASIYRNESEVGGRLEFVQVSAPEIELTDVTGAYPVDIDADGIVDLAILRRGENVLLKGAGDCRFGRANELWGFDGGEEWTTAFSATWENEDARPTMAFGNYLSLEEAEDQTGLCSDNVLVRPIETRQYRDYTPLSPGLCSLSVLFSDWSREGRADLRVTNDKHYYREGEEQLWTLSDGSPRLYERDEGWKKLQIWGMGIASHDVTGDGLPEIFLASQGDNKLQTLTDGTGAPTYSDIAIRRGVTAHRPYTGDDIMPSTAWHPDFQDVNNDGFTDLYVAKGNVDSIPEYAAKDPNNLLIGQPDGTFIEGAEDAGIVHFARTRGAAVVDFNLDGLLDLVEVNRVEPVRVWRNVGSGDETTPAAMGNWIAIDLKDGGSNRDGIGAWIEVAIGNFSLTREVTIGGGHGSGQLGWTHFGLGPASGADVRVIWPDGEVGPWFTVEAGERVMVGRDADAVEVVMLTDG